MKENVCWCYSCTVLKYEAALIAGMDIMEAQMKYLQRYFLCSTCGNKRCPHATDHALTCTGSNEPGQKGSNYE